jgi:hypothetical protein
MSKKIKFKEACDGIKETVGFPQPSLKYIPDWFKSIPAVRHVDGQVRTGRASSTVKGCLPFLDAMSTGYTISLGQDIEVQDKDNTKVLFWTSNRDPYSQFLEADYPETRSEGMPVPYGYDSNIWRVNTGIIPVVDPGCSILVTHPFNRYDLPYLVLSGVIDADKAHRTLAANIYIRKDFVGIIDKDTPLLQIFPFKRENWKKEDTLHNKKENLLNDWKLLSTIERSYQKNFWSKKTYQ